MAVVIAGAILKSYRYTYIHIHILGADHDAMAVLVISKRMRRGSL